MNIYTSKQAQIASEIAQEYDFDLGADFRGELTFHPEIRWHRDAEEAINQALSEHEEAQQECITDLEWGLANLDDCLDSMYYSPGMKMDRFGWMWEGAEDILIEAGAEEYVKGHMEVWLEEHVSLEGAELKAFTEAFWSELLPQVAAEAQAEIDNRTADSVLESVMTASEVADTYDIANATVRQTIARGAIRARKSGSTWLILRSDAERFWNRNAVQGVTTWMATVLAVLAIVSQL